MKYSIVLSLVAAVSAAQYAEESVAPVVSDVYSEVVSDVYSEVVPTEAVSDVYSEVVPTEAVSDVYSEVVPTEAVSDVYSEVETDVATEDVEYTTEIVESYTTYCPEPTTITDGDNVITVTEPTIVTITHCPGGCTIEVPCTTTSAVVCEDDCEEPAEPTGEEPIYPPTNGTATFRPSTGAPEPTGAPPVEEEPEQAGAAKIAGLGLAAFVGLAAFL